MFWAVLTAAAMLAACARTLPEERLRTTIAGLEAAIEQHDGSTIEDAMADDFIGPGGLDRQGARRLAQGAFLRYRDVGVNLGPLQIDLHAEHATVRFTAVLTGGARMLPDSGQLYDVETSWRLEEGEWRLVNAAWEPRL